MAAAAAASVMVVEMVVVVVVVVYDRISRSVSSGEGVKLNERYLRMCVCVCVTGCVVVDPGCLPP